MTETERQILLNLLAIMRAIYALQAPGEHFRRVELDRQPEATALLLNAPVKP